MPTVPLISVIDHDESFRWEIAGFVRSSGFAVEVFASVEQFLELKRTDDTECVIINAQMPGMGGLQLQSQLASAGRHIPIIFVAACLDETSRARARELGAVDLLRKPFGQQALLKQIRSALRVKE